MLHISAPACPRISPAAAVQQYTTVLQYSSSAIILRYCVIKENKEEWGEWQNITLKSTLNARGRYFRGQISTENLDSHLHRSDASFSVQLEAIIEGCQRDIFGVGVHAVLVVRPLIVAFRLETASNPQGLALCRKGYLFSAAFLLPVIV